MRQGLGAAALAAITVAIVSLAVNASPLVKSRSPSEPIASRLSPFRQALIYAKEGSPKLVDGRWNLGQAEAKLGIELSDDETKQLMACTGQIVCETPEVHNEEEDRVGVKVTATAVSVLKPDLLVTARHVLFKGKKAAVSFERCSFRSYSQRKTAIPVLVEKDQRKGFVLNNEDFVVLRLKRELAGCRAFAIDGSDSSLRVGEPILSVTGQQLHSLNKISNREPVLAMGTIRRVLEGVLGGPPFYYADIDLDEGGSGGAVFALTDRRPQLPHADRPLLSPVSDDEGRLVLRGISVAFGPRAKSGKPYSDERNYTIVIGLEAEFRELVDGQSPETGCGGTGALSPRRGGQDQCDFRIHSADSAGNPCASPSAKGVRPRSEARPQERKGERQLHQARKRTATSRVPARKGKTRIHAEERHELPHLLHL